MLNRHKLATICGLMLASSSAFAAEPGKDRWGLDDKATPAVREQKMREFQEKFEAARVENKKFVSASPSLSPQSYTAPQEIKAVIERVRDGYALISTSYAKELEPNLAKIYTKVTRKEQIGDMTIYDGRLYRMIRIQGDKNGDYEHYVGKEMLVSIRSANIGGQQLVGIRPAK